MRKHLSSRRIGPRLILVLLSVLILLPLVFTLIYSFLSPEEAKGYMAMRNNFRPDALMEMRLVPRQVSLVQYWQLLITDRSILHYFTNSAVYALLILAGQLLILPAFAFALSCFRFRGRDLIAFLTVLLMVLPFQVTMVPNVLTLRALNLLDTLWAVILPMVIWPFGVFLLRQFMVTLPKDTLEAAQLDGAGAIRTFLHVALPVSGPVIGALIALSFAESWNMVEQPLAYLTERQDLLPLSAVFGQMSVRMTGIEFAGGVLFIFPSLFVYLYFQQDIIEGLHLGEIK